MIMYLLFSDVLILPLSCVVCVLVESKWSRKGNINMIAYLIHSHCLSLIVLYQSLMSVRMRGVQCQ